MARITFLLHNNTKFLSRRRQAWRLEQYVCCMNIAQVTSHETATSCSRIINPSLAVSPATKLASQQSCRTDIQTCTHTHPHPFHERTCVSIRKHCALPCLFSRLITSHNLTDLTEWLSSPCHLRLQPDRIPIVVRRIPI